MAVFRPFFKNIYLGLPSPIIDSYTQPYKPNEKFIYTRAIAPDGIYHCLQGILCYLCSYKLYTYIYICHLHMLHKTSTRHMTVQAYIYIYITYT